MESAGLSRMHCKVCVSLGRRHPCIVLMADQPVEMVGLMACGVVFFTKTRGAVSVQLKGMGLWQGRTGC
jgi:hypothetical protein